MEYQPPPASDFVLDSKSIIFDGSAIGRTDHPAAGVVRLMLCYLHGARRRLGITQSVLPRASPVPIVCISPDIGFCPSGTSAFRTRLAGESGPRYRMDNLEKTWPSHWRSQTPGNPYTQCDGDRGKSQESGAGIYATQRDAFFVLEFFLMCRGSMRDLRVASLDVSAYASHWDVRHGYVSGMRRYIASRCFPNKVRS
jgi:hypothetical protein